MAARWAYKLGEALANRYTLFEASQKIELEPSSYGAVDPRGYNAMGDYSGMCTR